ncbi:hypothetical protein BAU15_04420 [Enterococcus sp. JM4C]|uniref:daptomycin-sensing surface protein LiaX n=1 Tax=Candidatus Enterococcus huntleyi TaxID=1857217 RepID=UPI00137B8927|nr:daptomycin-sensing surface protein LiaX [Enterococcus sp. JM4C]KAF1295784.1 hypothetical protein BAU15_04420 [Enterococcus sp. JM4C]
MKERERILDLVKKGVLSTEEALDLLETMATAKDEQHIEQAADKVSSTNQDLTNKANSSSEEDKKINKLIDALENGQEVEEPTPDLKDKEQEDKENLEKILDDLATEANQASVELDEINAEIQGIRTEIKEKQEQSMQLDTKEELGSLTDEELENREALQGELEDLEDTLSDLLEEKLTLEAELKNIRKNQWSETKESIGSKFDIPDDWKDQANETLGQVGGKMAEAGTQLGKFLKQTFQTVSESVNDNMEWKDISLRVPGIASTKFEHEFYYEAPQASILDVKVANGNIQFKTWDKEDVKVEAKIRLYGKMDAETPFEAFEQRSQINVDDDQISFQIPNKRIRADLVFYLPTRVYDHVSVKLLNGNLTIDELEVKDAYTKSTNGNIQLNKIKATMLEIEGVNGNIGVSDSQILDSIVETVNGNASFDEAPQNVSVSLVNGDIRITAKSAGLHKIEASSVNGNVKVAIPVELGVDGYAKTSLGRINSRMSDYEVVREKKERTNQMLQFRRVSEEQMAQVSLSTTTGSIFIKDTDK